MILVIGASGFIGNKVYQYFKEGDIEVKGTYFSNSNKIDKEGKIYLNLESGDITEIKKLKGLNHAIFCHGISDIEKCRNDQTFSNLVNVKNTFKLLEYCKDTNVIPVYLSTNMVFDGKDKLPSETDAPSPILEYGKQKLDVENFIINNFEKYIILRLTKVFGVEKGDGTLFTSWLDKLLMNENIIVAKDIFISPIYVADVVKIIVFLLENQDYGIFNLGGPEIGKPSDFAEKMVMFFGFDLNLVKKVLISSFAFAEGRPRFNSLDSKNIRQSSGIYLTALDDCLVKIGINYGIFPHQ